MEAAEPHWLRPDELAVWMKLSVLLFRLPQQLDAQLQRDAGLSWFEYLVLAGLSEAPDRTLRMSRLAVLTNGSLSRLSHGVTRLERRGWVVRGPCPEDGRYTNATLTDAGMAKVVATAPGHVARVRQLVADALEPEHLGQVDAVLDRLLPRLGEDC
jgi:DNA-binding MarR family transcriptional regulator